jgi:hypothetical protein
MQKGGKMSIRSRKYQLTINNPDEHGISHEIINDLMKSLNWIYYCLADEIGAEEHTPHIHLYFCCKNAISFDRVKKLFPTAHIEACIGSSKDNRDYIRKEGKHSDKNITSLPDTFEEYGELPDDTITKNETVSADVLNMIENGCSNSEIIKAHPSYLSKISHIENARNMLVEDKFKNTFRLMYVEYIFGDTGTGKTRYVMEKYGYDNVYKVTNYLNPFDNYRGQDVLLLDEFHSSLLISDLLQYLDGYPCRLSARYIDKWACFTKVYIVSNIDLDKQYPNIQKEDKKTFNAFIRRINKVTKYENNTDLPFDVNGVIKYDILPESYLLED